MKTAKYNYKHCRRPKFLQGCFYWKGRGYHYGGSAPEEVMSPGGWADDDPWIALASVLESAKRADYSQVSRLRKWIVDKHCDPTLVSACLGLTADAGRDTDLEFLAELMIEGPNYLRIEASLAAQWSGLLWLMPFMLEAWRVLDRRANRAAVEADISNLLDPIESEPEFYASGLGEIEYFEAVESRIAALKSAFGGDGVSISGGMPVDINQQVRRMRRSLEPTGTDEWNDWGSFLIWRRKFEVYSGIDCSGFYGEKAMFQPQRAAAILDRYMASPTNFEVGRRYFFGQLVP